MAYTTLTQGNNVVLTLNDAFDSVEVINRTQDLATVALTSGTWVYGGTPQQHSGRRTYQLSSAGSITLTASSGALQYEQTNSSDPGGQLTAAEVLATRGLVGVTSSYANVTALHAAADAGSLTAGSIILVDTARYIARSASTFSLVPLTIADAIGGGSRTVTGTTTETTLFSVTVPASYFHKNAVLFIRPFWQYTNSANNKVLKVKAGGVNLQQTTATTTATWYRESFLRWRNSLTAQVYNAVGNTTIHGNSANAAATTTIDPSAGVLIEATGTLSNTGESITLEAIDIEVK